MAAAASVHGVIIVAIMLSLWAVKPSLVNSTDPVQISLCYYFERLRSFRELMKFGFCFRTFSFQI